MRPFHQFLGSDPIHDHLHHFETSWLLPPYLLASLRALFSLYAFVTIFFIFGWNGQHSSDGEDGSEASRRSFSYFTHLSFWGVAFYFLVSAVHTFLYARTGRSVLFDKWPRVFRALHSLFYTTITNFPFVVLVVYWTILFEGPWFPEVFDAWTNVCTTPPSIIYICAKKTNNLTPTDLPTRPPLLPLPLRNPPLNNPPPTNLPPTFPLAPPSPLPLRRIPHPRHSGLLHLLLPRPGPWRGR